MIKCSMTAWKKEKKTNHIMAQYKKNAKQKRQHKHLSQSVLINQYID